MTMSKNPIWIAVAVLVCWASFVDRAVSHEVGGHEGPTYRVAPPRSFAEGEPCLELSILDAETGWPTPARFSIVVDGETYTPDQLGPGGIVFETIHTSKRQRLSQSTPCGSLRFRVGGAAVDTRLGRER